MKKLICIALALFIPLLMSLLLVKLVIAATKVTPEYNLYPASNIPDHNDTLVYTQTEKLIASDYEDGDAFGDSFDVDGNYIVVGNPFDDDYGPSYGSVYIFERIEGTDEWNEIKIITPTLGDPWGSFGWSVAISDTTIVVGAPAGGSSTGEAYVYEKDMGGVDNWGFVKKLSPTTLSDASAFGRAVDVYDDTIVVGAYSNSAYCDTCGSAFIFERNLDGNNNWGLLTELYDPDASPGDYYGVQVSLFQDTFLISSENRDYTYPNDNLGAVFIYYRDYGGINNWGSIKIIQPLRTLFAHEKPMKIKGDTAIIGSTNGVRIFGRDFGGTDNWGQLGSLYGSGEDSFGMGVDILDNYAVVGEPYNSDIDYQAGAALMYSSDPENLSGWSLDGDIRASDGDASDAFGNMVHLTSDQVFISAYQADINDIQTGAIYIYKYRVIPAADLSIVKSDNLDPIIVSNVLTYTLLVNNAGPRDTMGVMVVDTLPTEVVYNKASPGCTEESGVVTCDVGNLADGVTHAITIAVRVPGIAGAINNLATVQGNDFDPLPDNNYDDEPTIVEGTIADLQISSMTDEPDPVLTGNYLTYNIQVYNAGPGFASDIHVLDTLPDGVIFVSGEDCSTTSSGVICSASELVSHGSKEFSITVITPSVEGTITNKAYITGKVYDPIPGNNTDIEESSVVLELWNNCIYIPILFR